MSLLLLLHLLSHLSLSLSFMTFSRWVYFYLDTYFHIFHCHCHPHLWHFPTIARGMVSFLIQSCLRPVTFRIYAKEWCIRIQYLSLPLLPITRNLDIYTLTHSNMPNFTSFTVTLIYDTFTFTIWTLTFPYFTVTHIYDIFTYFFEA